MLAQMDPNDCWHGASPGRSGYAGKNIYSPGACTWGSGGWTCAVLCNWNGSDCGGFNIVICRSALLVGRWRAPRVNSVAPVLMLTRQMRFSGLQRNT